MSTKAVVRFGRERRGRWSTPGALTFTGDTVVIRWPHTVARERVWSRATAEHAVVRVRVLFEDGVDVSVFSAVATSCRATVRRGVAPEVAVTLETAKTLSKTAQNSG